jgi:serine/threonine protein kinase
MCSGGTSAVHSGKYLGRDVAIKMFVTDVLNVDTIAFFHKENSLCAALTHPNIVAYYGLCVMVPYISLVFELCERGSLFEQLEFYRKRREAYLDEYGPDPLDAYGCIGKLQPAYARTLQQYGQFVTPPQLDWSLRLQMAVDAARALQFLHQLSPPYMHRDVKSQNLLLTRDGRLKLSDFGECRDVSPHFPLTPRVGTVNWMAPEVMMGVRYDQSVDIYGLGMVMWELLTYQYPFNNMSEARILREVPYGLRPMIPEDCPKAYAKLMAACWSADPAKRPSADKLVHKLTEILEAERASGDKVVSSRSPAGRKTTPQAMRAPSHDQEDD